jgi:hypothetical protein
MQKCCNNNYVGWFCPRCGSSVSFIDHGGSEPVSVGHLASKNVTINQQLIQGDYIAEGGAKIGTNYENTIYENLNSGPSSLANETNVTNALPPPPANFEDGETLPPPPADFEDGETLPPPPADFEDGDTLPPPPADFEDGETLPPPPANFEDVLGDILPPPPADFEQGVPPINVKATIFDQGFEWIEHPPNSDKWFYRRNDTDEWELMK